MAEVINNGLPNLSEDGLIKRLEEDGLWVPRVQFAAQEAQRIHGNQYRDSGAPFLTEHIYPVTFDSLDLVQGWFDAKQKDRGNMPRHQSEQAQQKATQRQIQVAATALLHDAKEWEPEFGEGLSEDEIDPEVAGWIDTLTKVSRVDKKITPEIIDIYHSKLRNANKKYPVAIKIMERINNTQSSIENALEMPDKLVEYNKDNELYYLEIADLLLNREPYDRLVKIIELGHAAASRTVKIEA
jgi:(p)ppGpp synthase/HD superfamily hydrolase